MVAELVEFAANRSLLAQSLTMISMLFAGFAIKIIITHIPVPAQTSAKKRKSIESQLIKAQKARSKEARKAISTNSDIDEFIYLLNSSRIQTHSMNSGIQ